LALREEIQVSSAPKLSRGALIGLVVGSMIGSGLFALPAALAQRTGGLGALIAWGISGFGMLMLAFVVQTLALRRPDLDAGIYAYARAGFGKYLGFVSAAGYWAGCCFADAACLILIKATLGLYLPVMGDGTTPVAIAGASLLLWSVHFLLLRGIRQAAAINTIATCAKIVPIVLFLVVVALRFDPATFASNFWGSDAPQLGGIAGQVRSTLLITVFVFVGIEGASVYSAYAKRREDVGVATVVGFASVLCLLVLITLICYGVMPRANIAALPTPSMAGVMNHAVGAWGGVFISVGLVISVLGNYLSWSLLAAEVVRSAASNGTMPLRLARENANGAPAAALWVTNGVIQVFLIAAWHADEAFAMALKMTSTMTLVPYLLMAGFGLKLAVTGKTYARDAQKRTVDMTRSALATAYAALMIFAGGTKFMLLSLLLYLPLTVLFVLAMREQGKPVFTIPERAIFLAIAAGAAYALYSLATGSLSI
jgi:arginine:ornithine antiporter/lysine permease